MDRETSNKIVYLNFVLSLFVVSIHTMNLSVYRIDNGILYWVEKMINGVAEFAVPTFFMISGYLFYRNYDRSQIKRKLISRGKTLVVPFLLWGVVNYLFLNTMKALPMIGSYVNDTGTPFALTGLSDMMIAGNSYLWFLRNLIFYHLLGFLWIPLVSKRAGFVLSLGLGLAALALPFGNDVHGICRYYVYYLLGMGIAFHGKSIFENRYRRQASMICLAVLIVGGVATVFVRNIWVVAVIRLSGCFLAWTAGDLLPVGKEPCGYIKDSFFIYLSHTLVLECVEKLILIFIGNNLVGAWIDYFAAPIITLTILYGLSLLLKRFPKLWSLLCGNRGSRA